MEGCDGNDEAIKQNAGHSGHDNIRFDQEPMEKRETYQVLMVLTQIQLCTFNENDVEMRKMAGYVVNIIILVQNCPNANISISKI